MRWRARLAGEALETGERSARMRTVNPAYIPRNHRVEEALDAAVHQGDLTLFRRLFDLLQRPYDDQKEMAAYAQPPSPSKEVYQTFCGT